MTGAEAEWHLHNSALRSLGNEYSMGDGVDVPPPSRQIGWFLGTKNQETPRKAEDTGTWSLSYRRKWIQVQ